MGPTNSPYATRGGRHALPVRHAPSARRPGSGGDSGDVGGSSGGRSDGGDSVTPLKTYTTYRNLAMELISLSRFFVQTHEQNSNSSTRLRKVLIAADDALKYTDDGPYGTSMEVDKKFGEAIDLLSAFENDFPSKYSTSDPGIGGTAAREATMSDTSGSPLAVLCALKERIHAKPTDNKGPRVAKERSMIVEFLILKSLPDRFPTIVRQALSEDSNLTEVLWNFSRFKGEKCLTLKQNPHFYENLPYFSKKYVNNFRCNPIEVIRRKRIYVLTDRPSQIYLEARQVPRAFGNVWCPQNALIFKDVCGKLEGEGIVGSSIKEKPNLRYCMERLSSPAETESMDWKLLQDWREPIRRLLKFPDPDVGNIHIRKRQHSAIDALNGDVLLSIFGSYRLDDDENWNLQLRWCKLIHVCRRWRHLILGSPSHLNLHLLCTNGISVANMLDHSPPLPIIINYRTTCATMTTEDEEYILLALQHHNRVRRIVLHAPLPGLQRFLAAMDDHFPILERLSILPTTDDDVRLVIPRMFQAPRLSHLLLGITLSAEPRSLASTVSLVALTFTIPRVVVYLPPEDLALQLQFVPLLEELSIIFSVPIPRSHIQKHAMYTPTMRATLLALKRFVFRGASAYLEGLLARINAPRLRNFEVTLFNQLIFALPVLSQFIHTTPELRFPVANLNFNRASISISISNHKEAQSDKSFCLQVSCKPFDWQVRSAAQICSALGRMLPGVDELSLDFYEHEMPPEWRNKVDSRTWYKLVRPFKGVKKLRVGHALALDLSGMLQPEEEPSELLLPVLEELAVEEGYEDNAFTAFIDARQRPDCFIQLVVCPSTRIPSMHTPGSVQEQERPWYEKYFGVTINGLLSVSF